MAMQIYNMESQWNTAWGTGSAVIWDITQPPFDTFALATLSKTREGDAAGTGAGGFGGERLFQQPVRRKN
jgi:hypothetical protein